MKFNVETTVGQMKEITLPQWMTLAVEGRKIDAIKAMREVSYWNGTSVGLGHAKMIVEDFMRGITNA